MTERKRRYVVTLTNCDCSSGITAYRKDSRLVWGPRCPACGKVLGFMETYEAGEVLATGPCSAVVAWRQRQKRKDKTDG